MRMLPPEGGSTMFEFDPELNAVFLRFYGTLWSEGALDQATKEVERIRSARSIGCETCRNLRCAGARDEGLSEEILVDVDDGFETTALAPRWKAALAWSDAVTGYPTTDALPLRAATAAVFPPAELAELTLQAGLAAAFAKAMVAWGPQPNIPVTVLPTPTPDFVYEQPDEVPTGA
jgi:alkylhydroperoxidase family enzyme